MDKEEIYKTYHGKLREICPRTASKILSHRSLQVYIKYDALLKDGAVIDIWGNLSSWCFLEQKVNSIMPGAFWLWPEFNLLHPPYQYKFYRGSKFLCVEPVEADFDTNFAICYDGSEVREVKLRKRGGRAYITSMDKDIIVLKNEGRNYYFDYGERIVDELLPINL